MATASLTYKKSGVNIDLADKLVDHIQKRAPAIGGFAGLFPLDLDGSGPWELVACTDGVGTKLKLAFALDKHDTIGIDLVAMSVNDRNGKLVASFPVEDSDQIMLVTDKGQLIRCPVEGIRIAGRSTQGVIVFDTAEDEHVVSVEHIGEDAENGNGSNGE